MIRRPDEKTAAQRKSAQLLRHREQVVLLKSYLDAAINKESRRAQDIRDCYVADVQCGTNCRVLT